MIRIMSQAEVRDLYMYIRGDMITPKEAAVDEICSVSCRGHPPPVGRLFVS